MEAANVYLKPGEYWSSLPLLQLLWFILTLFPTNTPESIDKQHLIAGKALSRKPFCTVDAFNVVPQSPPFFPFTSTNIQCVHPVADLTTFKFCSSVGLCPSITDFTLIHLNIILFMNECYKN